MLRRAIFITASLLVVSSSLASAQPAVRRIRGTIESLQGDMLNVRTREGDEAHIKLAPGYGVAAVVPAQMSDIKPGVFIGTAAVGPKDKLRAAEVVVFPEAMRGAGEGHYPWDLMPESTMTNANIEAESAGTNGRVLTLNAKGEKLDVTVPDGVPVVTFAPGTQAMLTPGAKVFIGAQQTADGLTAARVAVGKDGLTPPM